MCLDNIETSIFRILYDNYGALSVFLYNTVLAKKAFVHLIHSLVV